MVDSPRRVRSGRGRHRDDSPGRGKGGCARLATSLAPMASRCAMVRVRRRLYGCDQAHPGSRPSHCPGSLATLRRYPVVCPPAGDRRLAPCSGGRGDRLARLCASPNGGAIRAGARKHPARTDLGLLAPASFFYSRNRHLRSIIRRVRAASNPAFRRLCLAVLAYERKPAAYHAAARSGEQLQDYRPTASDGVREPVWSERFPGGVAHGGSTVVLRRVLPYPDAKKTRSLTA